MLRVRVGRLVAFVPAVPRPPAKADPDTWLSAARLESELSTLKTDLDATRSDLAKFKAAQQELAASLASSQSAFESAREAASAAEDALQSANAALANAPKSNADGDGDGDGPGHDASELLHGELDTALTELSEARDALTEAEKRAREELAAVRAHHDSELQGAAEERVRVEHELKGEIERVKDGAEAQLAGLRAEVAKLRLDQADSIASAAPAPAPGPGPAASSNGEASGEAVDALREELRRTALLLESAYREKDEAVQELHLANTKKISDQEAAHQRDLQALQELNMHLQTELANRWV